MARSSALPDTHDFVGSTGAGTRSLPLRALLVLAFGGLMLGLAALVTVVVGHRASALLKQEIGSDLADLAFQLRDKLDRGMFERWRDIQIVASLEAIRTQGSAPDAQREVLERLRTTFPDYAWIGFADASGRVRASTGGLLENVDVSQRHWFVAALTGPYVGDVHDAVLLATLLGDDGDEPKRFVDVAAPVRADDGTLLGVVGAHLSWTWAREVERSLLTPRDDQGVVDIFVLAKDGAVLLGPPGDAARLRRLSTELDSLGQAFGFLIEDRPNGRRYLTGYSTSEGYRSYPGLGWRVLARRDLDEAFTPVTATQREMLAWAAASTLVFVIIAYLGATWIAAPLRVMARVADRLRRGGRSGGENIPTSSRYEEVATLSRALRRLVMSLDEHEAELRYASRAFEAGVDARTRDLRTREAELREAKEKAERAHAAKSQLLAATGHDLRQPLTAIAAALSLMERSADRPPDQRWLARAHVAVAQLNRALGNLLTASLLEHGALQPLIRDIPIDAVLRDVVDQQRPEAEAKGLRLRMRPVALSVRTDPDMLHSILQNLLSNAIRYTKAGGVLVGCRRRGNRLTVQVIDTGPGIAAKNLQTIFEPFERLGASDRRGTGLGLSIARRTADMLGHKLSVESAVGRGSCFAIELPIAAAAEKPPM